MNEKFFSLTEESEEKVFIAIGVLKVYLPRPFISQTFLPGGIKSYPIFTPRWLQILQCRVIVRMK